MEKSNSKEWTKGKVVEYCDKQNFFLNDIQQNY